ncbi:microtubule-destabilizing protein 60 [Curcuma longa]|uniref:microtubule-destabilizing protein 60 n=1 Tax=Curcuma longa TaxID=136217 RepID=UPI003D9FAB91
MEEHGDLKDIPHSKSCMAKQGGRNNQHAQPFNLHTEQRGHRKEQELVKRAKERVIEETRRRIPIAQGLPFTTDKPQNLAKPAVKEQTKPRNIRLHTEQRAAQRAGYNHLVASKINSLQILRRFEEKLLKHIEEEEIKSMRREMVPKAQLMPIFDKPFSPQRSTRPLTVPREPCFHPVKPSYSIMSGQPYKLHKYLNQTMKSI